MKRISILFCLLLVGFLFSTGLFAQVDNLTNMSAEWIRMANRNAATDAVDIVVYNPAGLTKLADGFHLNISNQTLNRQPQHSFDLGLGLGKEVYTQDSMEYLLPAVYAAYKKDKWALFAGLHVPAGGAVADYPHGSITSSLLSLNVMTLFGGLYDFYANDSLEATSLYLSTTVGGAYAFNDAISIAAGVRFINVKNTVKASTSLRSLTGFAPALLLSIDAEDNATGTGAVFGLNISTKKGLNIGIHYETKVKLEFTADVNEDSFGGAIIADGAKSRRDLPAMLGIGVSYDFTAKLRGEVDFNYFFQKQADWGTVMTLMGELEYSELAGDCYSLGACLAYQVNPEFQVSAGFLYTIFDFKDMDTYFTNLGAFEVLYSDNVNLAAGFCYALTKNIKLNWGVSCTVWKDETIKALVAYPLDVNVETTNSSLTFAIGANISL